MGTSGQRYRYDTRTGLLLVLALAVWLVVFPVRAQEPLPALSVEISPDHPLFLFTVTPSLGDGALVSTATVQTAWNQLPEVFKSYSVLVVRPAGSDAAQQEAGLRALLPPLQEARIPVAVEVWDGQPATLPPLELVEGLLRDFTCIKGVMVRGLSFNEYSGFSGDQSVLPEVRWLTGLVQIAPRYGRFTGIRLEGMGWPRALANQGSRLLYDALVQHRAYVIPIAGMRGPQHAAGIGSLMGLALGGGPPQWGVSPTSDWYTESHLAGPGVFGVAQGENPMPAAVYKAMVLIGAMTGATVYEFGNGEDLWNGIRGGHWYDAIQPVLLQTIEQGLIAREQFVREKVKVVYQMAPAGSPREFRRNQRDLDEVNDRGLMIQGAYGIEMAGQIPELIPNSGRHYWVPVFSPHTPRELLQSFARVVRPGEMDEAGEWTELLDRHLVPDGMGSAFITSVGRGCFILNTREVTTQAETFRLPMIPAPVRGIEAARVENGIELTWPAREGDVAYKVFRRIPPDPRLTLLEEGVSGNAWIDTTAPPEGVVGYSISALTRAVEPFEGVVQQGEVIALSTVESRIAEEVEVGTLLGYARSRPIEVTAPAPVSLPVNWWLRLDEVPAEQAVLAQTIGKRIEQWSRAVTAEDLTTVSSIYSDQYADPEGWGKEYVKRTYQWFFEQNDFCRMNRQVRSWSFAPPGGAGDQVEVVVYVRFAGVAPTDSSGRFADQVVTFPRAGTGETRLTFKLEEGEWRVVRADPALPNMRDLLGPLTGPDNPLPPGPDAWTR